MVKNNYKILIILSCGVILLTCASFCYASVNLEVNYPQLQTGSTITTSTGVPEFFRYFFDFGMFVGFFAIFMSYVIAGVLYLISPAKPDTLSMAKDRISGATTALILLATVYLIVVTINPNLKFFTFQGLPTNMIPDPPDQTRPGVYLNTTSGCADSPDPITGNKPDLQFLKNKVISAKIVQNQNQGMLYIGVLFDSINFWGKCQYLNPRVNCQTVQSFADSITVHRYTTSPSGNGVSIYRRASFDQEGGYVNIPNSNISGIYMERLENLRFTGSLGGSDCNVPKDEQDCTGRDKNGVCVKRECPNLSGENISSIKIDGDYFVILAYIGPSVSDINSEPMDFCQGYPKPSDFNGLGPKQVKWDSVRNNGKTPNYILIFPVLKK